ncbi:gamma-butyrobetaine hydroxylase-like domain-containing protein [Rhodobacteraceae bacterium DSL-40]|uniref:gamma-butyrobetaine hydroxylase-like domain-containing protein n=1 Tax=Amaricoccus sp. B4 TaxID=3368557 RepID=UPI000DACC12D
MEPTEIEISADGAHLSVAWADLRRDIPAGALRAAARDAASVRLRMERGSVPVAAGLRLVDAACVGAMGVNLHFSDGHDRAIYPWTYLREIAETPAALSGVN